MAQFKWSATGSTSRSGWLTGKTRFTKSKTASTFSSIHVDRLFVTPRSVEYGPVTVVMHQNVFAYLAAMVTSTGEFIFGEGLMTYLWIMLAGLTSGLHNSSGS